MNALRAAIVGLLAIAPAFAETPEQERLRLEVERAEQARVEAERAMKKARCEYLARELQVEGVRRDSIEQRRARDDEIGRRMTEAGCLDGR